MFKYKKFFVLFTILLAINGCFENRSKAKIEKLRDLVSLAHQSIVFNYQLYKSKSISETVAKQRAKALVKSLRYGSENADYFYIVDANLKMVMHPYKPGLEGKNVSQVKDKEGKAIFKEMLDVCQKFGEGSFDYRWQYKDQRERIIIKIGYVKLFKPWGWVVGTADYLEE
jgi:signal transduction histidine kinase